MTRITAATRTRLLLSAGAIGLAGTAAGLGTFAAFTSTSTAAQPVTAATVRIDLGATGTSANRLTVAASGVVPGDTIQRSVDVANSGDDLAGITLTTSASPSTALTTDTTHGLQVSIDRCSAPWTEGGSAPAYTYTCSGTTTSVLAARPIIGSDLVLSNLSATAAGATDHLRVTVSLPSSAPSTMQGASTTVTYAFTGEQRAPGHR